MSASVIVQTAITCFILEAIFHTQLNFAAFSLRIKGLEGDNPALATVGRHWTKLPRVIFHWLAMRMKGKAVHFPFKRLHSNLHYRTFRGKCAIHRTAIPHVHALRKSAIHLDIFTTRVLNYYRFAKILAAYA